MKTLSLEYLNQLFYIDSENNLRWKIQKGRRNPHEIAGRISTHGYYEVRINGQMKQVHRIMFQMFNQLDVLDDSVFIDHIDLNRLNNSKDNLRVCTKTQNRQNRTKQSNNTSGFKGVSYDKKRNKWQAGIGVNGKRIGLGRFDTPELAYEAYCKSAKEIQGEFFHP